MAPANRLHSSDRLSGQARGGDAPLWGRVNGSADWPRRGRQSGAVNLTLAEAAMLVGLIHAPSRLAPTRSLDMARARADTVLAAMVETGAITEAQGRRTPANLFIPASLPQHL
jgi:Transglycosylase